MAEAPQIQVYQFPVEIVQQSSSSNVALRTRAAASATGNLEEAYSPTGTKVKQVDVNGNMTLGDGTTAGNLTLALGKIVGAKRNVVSGSGATVTLTAAQSGAVCLNDRAAGIVWTLPAPAAGLEFEFDTTVSVTTNSYKIITDAGTTLLIGSLVNVDTDSSNAVAIWTANGSTHIAITMAAASTNSTGGLIGSRIKVRCDTATQWMVEGVIQSAGTVATPFATS